MKKEHVAKQLWKKDGEKTGSECLDKSLLKGEKGRHTFKVWGFLGWG